MNTLIDMPPMLRDGSNTDLVNMRNYLIRLAQSLTAVENAPGSGGTYVTTAQGRQIFTPGGGGSEGGGAVQKDIDDIRKNARNLQALIIKTANDLGTNVRRINGDLDELDGKVVLLGDGLAIVDGQIVRITGDIQTVDGRVTTLNGNVNTLGGQVNTLNGQVTEIDEQIEVIDGQITGLNEDVLQLGEDLSDSQSYVLQYTNAQVEGLDASMKEIYVAKSEYGTFVEDIDRRIENTAKDTIESYGYQSLIESAQETADGAAELIMNYSTVINGQIRRGIVLDPDTGDYVTGIAISQNLQFTGQEITKDDGNKYYYLSSGQTFGLYTATGWQFWIDGTKRGWYSSVDGALHISKLYIENSIQFGATAIIYIESSGRFGIKHLGGT